ncbi:hypothetical protein [Blastopirellula marina]|nr:hypothetical protein [Blastopirellula marina]
MTYKSILYLAVVLAASLSVTDAWARGGRGGGGGGGISRPSGGGGGISRPSGGGGISRPSGGASISRPSAPARTPSMSRPATPSVSRPNVSRPSTGGGSGLSNVNRPNISKPDLSNRPSINRPTTGGGTNKPNISRPDLANRPSTGDRPTFNKPDFSNRPNLNPGGGDRPNIANRPNISNRPSGDDLKNFLDLPGGGNARPNLPNQGNIGDRVSNIDRDKVGDRVNNIGDRTNIGGGDKNINIGGGNNVNIGNRENNINSVRNKWSNYDNRHWGGDRPFGNNWWNNGPYHNNPAWRWQAGWGRYPGNWCWRPAAWAAFGTWFAWSWSQPVVYDYGTNVVYRDNYVYVNDQQYASADQYYQQADTIAQSVPQDADPAKVDWMPLGVFAVCQQDGADTGMLIQLAVSKEGILAGTFYNDATDAGRPLQGMVDKTTQRAAWKFADGKNEDIVMETAVYNLTQDDATALVHFGQERTETWIMVRLPEPAADGSAPASN